MFIVFKIAFGISQYLTDLLNSIETKYPLSIHQLLSVNQLLSRLSYDPELTIQAPTHSAPMTSAAVSSKSVVLFV